MTPAEELRAAATRLREAAKDTTPTDGNPSGWLGSVNETSGAAFIYGGPAEDGYRTGVVFEFKDALDCEECTRPSAADLDWMWLMCPLLAEPLAAWLEVVADEMKGRGAVEGSASKTVHPVNFMFGLEAPRDDWTAALATARAINGGAS